MSHSLRSVVWVQSRGARLAQCVDLFGERQLTEGWARDKSFSHMTGAWRETPAAERRRLFCWKNKRLQTQEALKFLTMGKYARAQGGFRFRDTVF